MILTLKFLIVCTIIGATFGDPWKDRKRRDCPVYPSHPYDPKTDADLLNAAMGVDTTNYSTIISVLSHRNDVQRTKIAEEFEKNYGQSLISAFRRHEINRVTDSDPLHSPHYYFFILTIEALMNPLSGYYAEKLHDAMTGTEKSENVLIEILVPLNNHDIKEISAIYKKSYKKELKDDLKDNTSGDLKDFLVLLSSANRSENPNVDVAAAIADAHKLYDAGEGSWWGTDKSTFNAIFVRKSFPQLLRIFEEYGNLDKFFSRKYIDYVIKNQFSGSIKDGYLAIAQCARSKSLYFAKELHSAISKKPVDVDHTKLTRIILTHSHIDMDDINKVYQEIYDKSIASDLIAHLERSWYNNYMCLLLELVDQ